MIGMSPGPQFDVSCSGPNVVGELIRAADEYCLNFGFLGRGASDPGAVEETVAGGALAEAHRNASTTLCTSLSPRPERFTSTRRPRRLAASRRIQPICSDEDVS